MDVVRIFLLLFSIGYTASLKSCLSGYQKLQAVDKVYTYDPLQHTDNKIIGRLSMCPRDNEVHGADLHFQLVSSQVTGMNLEEHTGFFQFTIPEGASESIYMQYFVTAGQESSEPAQIIIHIPGPLDGTLLSLADISGTEGDDIPMDLGLLNLHGDVTVALCNCDEDITCNYYTGNCNCRLNLPRGWQIYDSNDQPLRKHRLTNMDIQQLHGLFLRAYHSGEKCLDVHEIRVERWDYDPQSAQLHKRKMQLHIKVKPSDRNLTITFDDQRSSEEPMVLHTEEGQPIQFVHLEVHDHVGNEGKYRVTVRVDEGGILWIRQDIREDVMFHPKLVSYDEMFTIEVRPTQPFWSTGYVSFRGQHRQLVYGSGFINTIRDTNDSPDANVGYTFVSQKAKTQPPQQQDVDSDFYQYYHHQDRNMTTNNGKKVLEFVGSLEGINEVLSTLMFIPWCKIWPEPPNWNIPEKLWMTVQQSRWNIVTGKNVDTLKPNVWPPWYTRYWHPYPDELWTRWPRVMPPFWLTYLCQDWTSKIHIEAEEITSNTCEREDDRSLASFDFEIHVDAQTSPPKTIVARNTFTYFDNNVRSFEVTNVEYRSKSEDEEGKLRFEIRVNNTIAQVRSVRTGASKFNCFSVDECNLYLQRIHVQFHDNVTDICDVKIKIKMYRGDSDRASDALVVWGIRGTDECVNMLHKNNYPKFNMEPYEPYISVEQGNSVPLNITPNFLEPDMKGVLNTFVYAEDGLVTVKASRDLRVFYDHMGMHAVNMTTFFSISGPAYDVIKALTTATFTPKKNFQGVAEVTIEYGMPPLSLKRVYNHQDGSTIPSRSLVITINVERGSLPASPILIHPQYLCSTASDNGIVPLDMVEVRGRHKNDEMISLSLYSQKGTLGQNITARYKCRPIGDGESRPAQCALHNTCQDDEDCVDPKKCCPQPAGCGYRCDDPIEDVHITTFSKNNVTLFGTTKSITDLFRNNGIVYSTTGCLTGENHQPKSYGIDTILFQMTSSRNPDKVVRESMTISVTCRTKDASQVPIPVPQDHGDHPL